jgi:hypothetical protein
MLPGHRVVRTSLREVERLYRQDYRRFVQVAAAITRDPEAAAEAVQEARLGTGASFVGTLRWRRGSGGSS